MIELADQVWFITGSSSGLSLALVKYLVSLNVKCIATSRNPSGIADIGRPDKYLALPVDVTKVDQIHSAFEKGLEKFQKITHVVNNAGYGLLGEFEGTMEEEARRQMEVNYWGIVNVSREALRIFREVNKPLFGRLINISSIGGVDAQPALPFYHSAKFALEGFSESISQEMDPSWNIHVTIAECGGMNTDWIGRSMIHTKPHPAYTTSSNPAYAFRKYCESHDASSATGDVDGIARALVNIGIWEKPPLRLALGRDALMMISRKLHHMQEQLDRYKEISASVTEDEKWAAFQAMITLAANVVTHAN